MANNKDNLSFPEDCNKLGMNEENFVQKLKEMDHQHITNGLVCDIHMWTKTKNSKQAGHWKPFLDCIHCIYNLQYKINKSYGKLLKLTLEH